MLNFDLEIAHNAGTWACDFLHTTFEYDEANAHQQRVAMVLTIDAALTDPDAVIRALCYVRDELVKQDPALGIIGGT